ncbi:MAG TPA: methionyl-tRNA formyltransferase [Rhizobium sp.]|nr:methionyl-tRNA formyltransferase [Rhizobium sp.]
MALVRQFEHKPMDRNSLHREIAASYSAFGIDGKRIIQIDTYGSTDREFPGKKSQTIQLDREGAENLFLILKNEFGFR